jgi:hypothetical protein
VIDDASSRSPDGIPAVEPVRPSGVCFCGCGEATARDKFFVVTHDRRAESRVIHERFGNIATFVAWAERYLPMLED